MDRILKSKRAWTAVAVAVLLGVYALLGFVLAPKIVRAQAITYVSAAYGRELQIGEVRVNPFLLQLEVADIAFPDTDGQTMLSLRRLFVDFEVASLWRRAFVFKEVSLESPGVRAVLRADGAMNLADLAPPAPAGPAPDAAPAAAPRLWIESLGISDGRVEYIDLARKRQPFSRRFGPVAFSFHDFRTTSEAGDFRFSARSAADEQLEWKGSFAFAPVVTSQGEFSIARLRAAGLAEFAGDALRFDVSDGLIDFAASYRVSLGQSTELKLQVPKFELSRLGVRARGESQDWIQVPSLVVTDTAVAMPEDTVTVGALTVAGVKVTSWLDAEGSINLLQLIPANQPAAAASAEGTGKAPASGKPAARAAKPWSARLARLEITDAAIEFEDRMKPPVKRFAIAPLNLRVSDASLDLSRPLAIEADATINDHAFVKVTGSVAPDPLAADLNLRLDKASLQILQPYVLPFADLSIRSGTLAMAGRLRVAAAAKGPQIAFAGDVTVDQFNSVDNVLGEDLVNFRRLQIQKIQYRKAPDALSIDRIALNEPYARVIISKDQVLNIAAVLDPQGAAADAETRKQRAEKRAVESKAAKQKVNAGAAPAPKTETMPIRIREFVVEGGRMNFSDFNVQPNFSAQVLKLAGTVTGLSSDPSSRANVDFSGNLDEFSPVVIGGSIQPFAFDRFTDINMKFQNISLPVFNPYAGRFAGYSIAKGKLDTSLHYLVRDRALEASHRIRIDQLEWGEASTDKEAASLPVKFATSLLKDKDGVIALDIPVAGTLDDPALRIGPIVWQIIKNLIVKAVTAPFALIGSLFKGAEDAQFVDFAAGDATFDAATTERLAALSRGLVEKRELKVDVPIGINAELDRPALAERQYQKQLNEVIGVTLGRRADDKSPMPAFGALTSTQKLDSLSALVRKLSGAAPKMPEPPAPPKGASRAEAITLAETAALAFLQNEARSGIVVADVVL